MFILILFLFLIHSTTSEITSFTNFLSTNKTEGTSIYFIHDWNTEDLKIPLKIKDEILKEKNVSNVVICDWSTFSRTPDYYNVAKRYTSRVASEIHGQIKGNKLNPDQVELIGHGLGAHIAGQVGKLFKGEIARITGLNPTGPYFKDNPNLGLEKSDAAFVKIYHTDKRYGIYRDIGHEDVYPEPYEDCLDVPLLKRNLCFHNSAQEIFLNSLSKNTKTEKKSQMSILTLDVSPSMQMHSRSKNMIIAAKRLIHSLPIGYSIGIVIFGGTAQLKLPPMNITSQKDREFIFSKLPQPTTQITNTSIGAGVKKAREVIVPFLKNYCPDIILVTDGEENQAPFIRDLDLLNDLKGPDDPICFSRIHTIALGNEASVGLESLSTATKGQTYFAADTNSLDKLTQSIVAASTAQFRSNPPIKLPLKKVESGSAASFQIDPTIGKNTTFFISSPNPGKLTAELIAPNGEIYGSTNYTTNEDLNGLLFKLLQVQPGNWTIKLNPGHGRKRRAIDDGSTVFVSTYPNDDGIEPIRLDAILSRNILESEKPVAIEGFLSRGYEGIIDAYVYAEIIDSEGQIETIELFDNGIGPDSVKDDGIYARYLDRKNLKAGQRYEVQVIATSHPNLTTMIKSVSDDPFKESEQTLSPLGFAFERQATPGSFRVAPTFKFTSLPPNPVKNLRVTEVDFEKRLVSLEWSSDDEITQLRGFSSDENKPGMVFTDTHVTQGSLTPNSTLAFVQVQVPEFLWIQATKVQGQLDLYFTLRIKRNGQLSQISNIAPAEFSIPYESLDEAGISSWLILVIVLIFIILVMLGIFFYLRRKKELYRVKSVNRKDEF